jgi:hypothetical protein
MSDVGDGMSRRRSNGWSEAYPAPVAAVKSFSFHEKNNNICRSPRDTTVCEKGTDTVSQKVFPLVFAEDLNVLSFLLIHFAGLERIPSIYGRELPGREVQEGNPLPRAFEKPLPAAGRAAVVPLPERRP